MSSAAFCCAFLSILPQEQSTSLEPANFTYAAGGPDLPGNSSDTGLTLSVVTVHEFPALEGRGVGMVVANFEACSINLPHLHPRATEVCGHGPKVHNDFTAAVAVDFGDNFNYYCCLALGCNCLCRGHVCILHPEIFFCVNRES